MYDHLKKQFLTVSRAAQMNLWLKLLNFELNPDAPTAGVGTQLKDIYAELKAVNIRLSGNSVLGLVLQNCIMRSSAGFRADFEQRIETMIQRDPEMK